VLKDVCQILGIENHKDLCKRLDDDEVGRFELPHPQNQEKTLEMLCANESGVYSVILRSDKPEAKQFKRWLTHEVIPKIRKTGSYGIKLPDFTSPALAARAWAEEFERRQTAESQRDEAIRTKAWIGSKREATAMAVAGVRTKERNKFKSKAEELEIELDKSKQFATIKFCEMKTKKKFDWHKLRNYCTSHELETKKVFDSNYGVVNSYPALAWEDVYGVRIEIF
jgi:prophage antirepressor-like protein